MIVDDQNPPGTFRLVRTRIGPLSDRSLAPGEWRALTQDEVEVIDTREHAIVDRFPAGQWPHDNHLSPDGRRVVQPSPVSMGS